MNRMAIVYHMALARSDGKVVVSRIGEVRRDGTVVSGTTYCVMLTPNEARRMAKAMRDPYGRFSKKDGDCTVEVWCEEYEAYEITWRCKDSAEIVCEPMNCCEGAYGDGWSWEFAQALDEAAREAEAGE